MAEGDNTLVLREPQLAAAKTAIDAAEAALQQARLDLERTKLRSPFDAQILQRMANLGSQVDEGMPVAEFLEVQIQGKMIEDVVRLPVDYLRKNDTAWIMSEEDKLAVRELEIAFKDSSYAYVAAGIAAGERIVTSSLSRVSEGAELRTEEQNSTTAE